MAVKRHFGLPCLKVVLVVLQMGEDHHQLTESWLEYHKIQHLLLCATIPPVENCKTLEDRMIGNLLHTLE